MQDRALSPYGTYDQSGNVAEWNEAIIRSSFRGLRGGDFIDDSLGVSSSRRSVATPAAVLPFFGFRVASLSSPATVPEPGSLAVWSAICLGGLRYRRRWARR
jgi:hypothetical protein